MRPRPPASTAIGTIGTINGWRAEVEKRRPAYLQAADKCLTAAGAAVAATLPPPAPGSEPSDPWRDVPTFDRVKPQILGHDACAITGGPAWSVFDNTGRQRGVPGFLADRIQRGFAVLDDRAWLQTALATVRSGLSVDETISQMTRGEPDSEKQFVWFGNTVVRHYLPNASLSIPVGRDVDLMPAATAAPTQAQIQRISSEHGSVRGTCNGGGDFIRFDPNDPRQSPPALGAPRIMQVAWSPTRIAAAEPDIRLELPAALVTADGGTARVVVDLAPNGAAAVLVVSGQVQVRETATGQSRTVSRGDAALVWPGIGVSQPARVSADRFAAASRPRIRGSIVLQPGQEWSGPLQLDGGILPIEARLLYEKPAGGNYVLEVAVNGHRVTDPVLNKMSPMRYADGRNYPYREPNTGRWLLFYSHDYAANNGPAGGGYEVKTDPGQAYRYVWNVAPMMGGNPVAIAPGSTTTTTGLAPPPPAVAAPPPAPSPVARPPGPPPIAPSASAGAVGQVAPAIPFGEEAVTGRISNIVTARDVRNGAAVDITDTFTPDVNPIHVWFRLAGFAPGTTLTSRWTFLGGSAPSYLLACGRPCAF